MSSRRRKRQQAGIPKSLRTGSSSARPATTSPRFLRIALVAIVAAAALVFVGIAFLGSSGGADYTCDSRLTQAAGSDGVTTDDLGSRHVAVGSSLRYAYCPPASGGHFSSRGMGPIPARFYGPESELSPGGWVHNLEHGYVVILYSCGEGGGACPTEAELASLRQFQATAPATPGAERCGIQSKVLTARFDGMNSRFAFLAWNRVALSEAFEAAAARAFAVTWIDKAPEAGAC